MQNNKKEQKRTTQTHTSNTNLSPNHHTISVHHPYINCTIIFLNTIQIITEITTGCYFFTLYYSSPHNYKISTQHSLLITYSTSTTIVLTTSTQSCPSISQFLLLCLFNFFIANHHQIITKTIIIILYLHLYFYCICQIICTIYLYRLFDKQYQPHGHFYLAHFYYLKYITTPSAPGEIWFCELYREV